MSVIKYLKKLIKEDNYREYYKVIYICDNPKEVEKIITNKIIMKYGIDLHERNKKDPKIGEASKEMVKFIQDRYKEEQYDR